MILALRCYAKRMEIGLFLKCDRCYSAGTSEPTLVSEIPRGFCEPLIGFMLISAAVALNFTQRYYL